MPRSTPSRSQLLTLPVSRLFVLLAAFAAVGVLLESDGLAHWADGLEPGPLRSAAEPATHAVQHALAPLGLGAARQGTLLNLARVGWSDDPALVAQAMPQPAASVAAPAAAVAPATAPFVHTAGASAPLAAAVPRTVDLPPLSQMPPGRPRTVALAGDSMMAVGLSAQFLRDAAGDPRLHIVKAFRSGTGLARPEVFDWMKQYPAMLGSEHPDVVLVAIGANDGQGFVVEGKVLKFGSEEWRVVYQQRVDDYLSLLESSGARVLWIGLPPMRAASFDEKIAVINRIDYTVVSHHPQAAWLSLTAVVGDANGSFREFGAAAGGKPLRLRAPDGIHLSDEGAGLLTPSLVRWLDPQPAAPPASSVAAPQAAAAAPAKPTEKIAARPHRPRRTRPQHAAPASSGRLRRR